MAHPSAKYPLRVLRGLAFGTVAAVLLLAVGMNVAAGLVRPDPQPDGSPASGRPEATPDGMAITLGHFEATTNWLTFLGGFLWGFATPAPAGTPTRRRAFAALAALGSGLVAYVVFFAFDDVIAWQGGPRDGRPWITLGLALCAAAATYLGHALSRQRGPGSDVAAGPEADAPSGRTLNQA